MPVWGVKSNRTLKMSFVEVLHSGRRVPLRTFFQNSTVFSHASIFFFFSTPFFVSVVRPSMHAPRSTRFWCSYGRCA